MFYRFKISLWQYFLLLFQQIIFSYLLLSCYMLLLVGTLVYTKFGGVPKNFVAKYTKKLYISAKNNSICSQKKRLVRYYS
jgi:hypothetical protein